MKQQVATAKITNFINGQWQEQQTEVVALHNPSDIREVVGFVSLSTPKDVDEAVMAAHAAKKQWAYMSSVDRAQCLYKAAELFEKNAAELATIATKEMGKRIIETKGEVLRAAAILRYYAGEGVRKIGELLPSQQENNLFFAKRVPLGVIGIIAPWNFPIAIPIWKMAPALIYGNTVVFKPSHEASLTGAKMMELLHEAGFPNGVINMIVGKGSVVGNALVEHEKVEAVTFTGSNQVGQDIAKKIVERNGKYQLELGGKNPVIILKDADLDLAATLTVDGAMKQTGQRCTATSRVYIEKDVYESFKEKVVEKVNAITVGNARSKNVTMGPVSSKNQYEKVLQYLEIGKKEATLVTGGEPLTTGEYEHGFYIQPTVFEHVEHDSVIAKEEIFGPVLALIEVNSYEEALEKANDTIYGLSASIFTNDISKAMHFIDHIEAGLVQVNGETGGAEPQAPFGGMKQSSSGSREQGQAAMEFFTTFKTVSIRSVR